MTRRTFRHRAWRGAMRIWIGVLACATPATAQTPPAPPAPPVIARVQGRPITQADFDRISGPYFAQLRGQYGGALPDDVAKIARQNVLNELIRRELLAVEFERRQVPVTEAETDALLKQDPFFLTNGRFDEAKFRQFKISPGSNYLQVLPTLRELAGAAKVDSILRGELRPSSAAVRAEWNTRNDQARFDLLAFNLREMNLEGESTPGEQRAAYEAHPEHFERKARLQLRYVKLPLPAVGDSARRQAETDSLVRAHALAQALARGTAFDSLTGGVPPLDTGLFETPGSPVPGLGRAPELAAALAPAESDTTLRVIGPLVLADGVLVGEIVARAPRAVPPFAEVRAEAKRFADQELRRTRLDDEKRAYYAAHPELFRTPRLHLTRVTLAESKLQTRWPSVRDIERWYQKNGGTLFSDPPAPLPPLSDSLRGVSRERLASERRAEQAGKELTRIALPWRRGRDPQDLVRGTEAIVETLAVLGEALTDSLFPASLIDSLLRVPASAPVGEVLGPRRFFGHAVVWRVEARDTAYTQPYENVQARVEPLVQDERRARDEVDAEAYFGAHRDRYQTKDKFALDVVAVAIPPLDSVSISEEDLRREYEARSAQFHVEPQVRARHILLSAPNPAAEVQARTRADSLRRAILGGADFAELARIFSDDPGSAAQGGDLGFFGRGRMVKAFEDTAFALAPGVVSHPVKTPFGWHLIQVEEQSPERTRSFEDVRAELHQTLAQSRGDTLSRTTAERIRRALARGADPATVSAGAGGVRALEPVAPGEALGAFGFAAGLAEDLAHPPVGRWLGRVYRCANAYLVVKPTRHVPPGPASFEEAKPQAVEDMREARRRELLDGKVAAVSARLAAGEPFDSVAADHGGARTVGPLPASSAFVPIVGNAPGVLRHAFAMKVGEVSDTLQTALGVAWIRLLERGPRPGASFAGERAALAEELLVQRYADWVTRRRRALKIEILRPDLREAAAPAPVITRPR